MPEELPETLSLAGPMRGYPFFNFAVFDAWAHTLRAMGYEVINPVEYDRIEGIHEFSDIGDGDATYERLKERNRRCVGRANALALIQGWKQSRGTSDELVWAKERKLPVQPAHVWVQLAYAQGRRP